MYSSTQQLYDHICRVLTDYEGYGDPDYKGCPKEMYATLIEITNMISDGQLVVVRND